MITDCHELQNTGYWKSLNIYIVNVCETQPMTSLFPETWSAGELFSILYMVKNTCLVIEETVIVNFTIDEAWCVLVWF